jgi:O-antigen/teichoic acid export membrane protein
MGLGIVTGVLTARLLLPKGKGELTAVLLWYGLFSNLGNVGMPHAVIYYSGQYEDDLGKAYGTAVLIGLLQGVVVSLAGFVSIEYILSSYSADVIGVGRILFLMAPIFFVGSYSLRSIQGVGDFVYWNVFRLSQPLIYLFSILLFWISDTLTVTNTIYGYILSNGFLLLLSGGYMLTHIRRLHVDCKLLRDYFTYGVRNWLAGMAGKANARLDQAIISTVLSAESLGLYRIAVSSTRPIQTISKGFSRVILSEVARSKEDGFTKIKRYLLVAAGLLLVAATIGVLSLPYVLPFVFGAEYTSAVPSARILCAASAVMGIKSILYNGIRGMGNPEYPLLGEVSSLAVTGGGLWLLLPRIGIEGAAISSLLAYGAASLVVYRLGLRRKVAEVS